MSSATLAPGTSLGNYVVESVLGQGVAGVTYRAHDTANESKVALKEYFPRDYGYREPDGTVRAISDADAREFKIGLAHFLDEARTLQSIDHPNVVPVIDVIETHGTCYVVMGYQPGETLESLTGRGHPWTEAELLRIAIALLDGLEVLHAAGVIHRDIKEGHIRLREDGTPVLLDFGATRVGLFRRRLLASHTDDEATLRPGLLNGDSTAWNDIHALGAMLYRLGRARESGRCGGAAVKRFWSAEAQGAIGLALNAKPDARPKHVGEWRAALEAVLHALPADASDSQRAISDAGGAAAIAGVTRPEDVSGGKAPSAARNDVSVARSEPDAANSPILVHDTCSVPAAAEAADSRSTQLLQTSAETAPLRATVEQGDSITGPPQEFGSERVEVITVSPSNANDADRGTAEVAVAAVCGVLVTHESADTSDEPEAAEMATVVADDAADDAALSLEVDDATVVAAPADDGDTTRAEHAPRIGANNTEATLAASAGAAMKPGELPVPVAAVKREGLSPQRRGRAVVAMGLVVALLMAIFNPWSPSKGPSFEVGNTAETVVASTPSRRLPEAPTTPTKKPAGTTGSPPDLGGSGVTAQSEGLVSIAATAANNPAPPSLPVTTPTIPPAPTIATSALASAPAAVSAEASTAAQPSSPTMQIQALLMAAAADVEALRLTTPKGSNAWEKYQQILGQDPENRSARQGIQAIRSRYLNLARSAMARGQFDEARRYLDRGEQVAPGDPEVRAVRAELDAHAASGAEARVMADRAGELLERVQSLLRRRFESGAASTMNDTRADEIPEQWGRRSR